MFLPERGACVVAVLLVAACSGHSDGAGVAASPDAGAAGAAPDGCVPADCGGVGAQCGVVADGCGGELECGSCSAPDTCGGGGVPHVCGQTCTPLSAVFFDLGDTLVEFDGTGFVERPGALELVAELGELGIRTGVVTNTPSGWTEADLRAELANPSLLDAFEVVLLSSEAASGPKPDPAIFAEAHGRLDMAPPIAETAFVTETLAHIGDRAAEPTEGARAAGMIGIHLSAQPASDIADFTVAPDALGELLAVTNLCPAR